MNRRSILVIAIVSLFVAGQSLWAAEKEEKKKDRGPGGRVKSVDAAANKITITMGRKGETQDKEYKVSKEVKVTIDGQSKSLGDVTAGMRVRLTLEGDEVVAINVATRKKKE